MPRAMSAASMGIVPDPHIGSINGSFARQPLARTIAAANVSRSGALATSVRYPRRCKSSPELSTLISHSSWIIRTTKSWVGPSRFPPLPLRADCHRFAARHLMEPLARSPKVSALLRRRSDRVATFGKSRAQTPLHWRAENLPTEVFRHVVPGRRRCWRETAQVSPAPCLPFVARDSLCTALPNRRRRRRPRLPAFRGPLLPASLLPLPASLAAHRR